MTLQLMEKMEIYIPGCDTTPRFMQSMSFLDTKDADGLQICICGKSFFSNFGEYDCCYECSKIIEEIKWCRESEDLV